MASNFPTSLDSFTDPTSASPLNSPSHAGQHQNINDAVEKVEVKLGIGASPASSALNKQVLTANGSGSTSWAYAPGIISTVTSTSTQTIGGGAAQDITSLTSTITVVAGRSYMVTATVACGVPGAGTANLNFRVLYNGTGTEYQSICLPAGNTGQTNMNGHFYFVAASSGSIVVKLQAYAVSQACALLGTSNLHRMTITDIGVV